MAVDVNHRPDSRALAPVSGALAWLMVAHFTNDLYNNFLPALLPILADVHGMTLGRAGLLISISTISGSLFQPVFGYVADSTQLRLIAAIGLSCAALGSALLGMAPSYMWLALVTVLHGIGTAAFHPQSAGFIHLLSGNRKGTTMAVYIMAGQSGQALSPMFAAYVAVRAGLPWVALTAVPALLVSLAIMRVVPWHWRVTQQSGVSAGLQRAVRQNLGGLARLMVLIMTRATLVHIMLALLPFMYRDRGAPATEGAAAIAAMIFAGALGGMVGGYLSDRYGRRKVLFVSFALASPLFLAAILSSGPATMIFLVLGGAALLGSSSLVTVEAQSLLPAHASMAAGLMLGVSMGIGGILVGPVSAIAQAVGIIPVLIVVSLLPLPGSILTLSLAGHDPGKEPRLTPPRAASVHPRDGN
ncbi:MAG: MFS transporter [Armatimonadetes bacterium]|nr:MFS transporter [Armatimonadota bacterium]